MVATFGKLRDLWRFVGTHPLTRERRIATAARVLRWQVESRLRETVVVPWVGGTKLVTRHGMTGASGSVYAGLHEFAEMAFLLHWLQPGDLFVDGGANVGSYTVLAAGVRRAKVVAFEPVPATVEALRRNIEANALGELVEVRQAALAEAPGALSFIADQDTQNRRTETGYAGVTLTVPAEILDAALAGRRPSLVKLDLEGGEAAALRGARATLAACPAWIVEADDARLRDVLAAGFAPFRYDPFSRRLAPATGGVNMIWLRDPAAAEARLRAAEPVQVLGRPV